MAYALFRPDERNDLLLSVQFHTESPPVPAGNPFTKLRKAFGLGVSMIRGVMRGFTQRVDDIAGRGYVRVADAKTDYFDTLSLLFGDLPADLHEEIRWDSVHSLRKPHFASAATMTAIW